MTPTDILLLAIFIVLMAIYTTARQIGKLLAVLCGMLRDDDPEQTAADLRAVFLADDKASWPSQEYFDQLAKTHRKIQ